jgi:hypothetical protein
MYVQSFLRTNTVHWRKIINGHAPKGEGSLAAKNRV